MQGDKYSSKLITFLILKPSADSYHSFGDLKKLHEFVSYVRLSQLNGRHHCLSPSYTVFPKVRLHKLKPGHHLQHWSKQEHAGMLSE